MIVVSPGSTELKNICSSNACAGMSKKLIIRQKILPRPLVDGCDRCWKAYCSGHGCISNAEWTIMDFRYRDTGEIRAIDASMEPLIREPEAWRHCSCPA